jgi:tRNA(Ile)-lysidine synthase
MVALDFLSRSHVVVPVFVHHGTEDSERAYRFLEETLRGKSWVSRPIVDNRQPDESPEEFWRRARYQAFEEFEDAPVVLAHHLDDCVETWVWSSMHGTPKTIPLHRGNCVRPFLLNPKYKLKDWATRHQVPWIEDRSNLDTRYTRNYIRREMMPHVLRVNPGIHKIISKKVRQSLEISDQVS